MSVGIPLDFHWFWSFGCGFAVSPLEVHLKSPLDFVVRPKMPGQAPENHRKNTVVKKQKNMYSAYPQSDGLCLESTRKSSGSVKTSNLQDIFIKARVRDSISLPCQHALSHYYYLIHLFGSPNGLCSSITESKHIKAMKEPWRRSN